jgi:hypothetical protein
LPAGSAASSRCSPCSLRLCVINHPKSTPSCKKANQKPTNANQKKKSSLTAFNLLSDLEFGASLELGWWSLDVLIFNLF